MHQPYGFRDSQHPEHVCLIKKSPYVSNKHLVLATKDSLTMLPRFSHNISDHSLFIYHHGNDTTYILIYVDDIILYVTLLCLNLVLSFPRMIWVL